MESIFDKWKTRIPRYNEVFSEPRIKLRSSLSLNNLFWSLEQKTNLLFSSYIFDNINPVNEPLIPVKKSSFPPFSSIILNSGVLYILFYCLIFVVRWIPLRD